jgi:hypothetical protein
MREEQIMMKSALLYLLAYSAPLSFDDIVSAVRPIFVPTPAPRGYPTTVDDATTIVMESATTSIPIPSSTVTVATPNPTIIIASDERLMCPASAPQCAREPKELLAMRIDVSDTMAEIALYDYIQFINQIPNVIKREATEVSTESYQVTSTYHPLGFKGHPSDRNHQETCDSTSFDITSSITGYARSATSGDPNHPFLGQFDNLVEMMRATALDIYARAAERTKVEVSPSMKTQKVRCPRLGDDNCTFRVMCEAEGSAQAVKVPASMTISITNCCVGNPLAQVSLNIESQKAVVPGFCEGLRDVQNSPFVKLLDLPKLEPIREIMQTTGAIFCV